MAHAGQMWSGARARACSHVRSLFACLFLLGTMAHVTKGRQGAQSGISPPRAGSAARCSTASSAAAPPGPPPPAPAPPPRDRADLADGPVGVAAVRPRLPSDHFRRRLVASYQPLEGRAEEEVLARRRHAGGDGSGCSVSARGRSGECTTGGSQKCQEHHCGARG